MLRCSYSTIDSDELMSKIVPTYEIEKPNRCQFWERGANDTYKIFCTDTNYFLRVYRTNAFPREANEFEAELLNYLHLQGFPVAYPIAKKSGGFISEVCVSEGIRYILVTALAEGVEPDYQILDHCRLVGGSLAQMHLSSAEFKTTYRRQELNLQWLLEDSLTTIQAYLSHLPDKFTIVDAVGHKVRDAVESVGEELLEFGICHGDFHGGNLHLCGNKVTQFDFEECAFIFRIYDLATFKWGECRGEQGHARWSAFVDGYKAIKPISEKDIALVDLFVVLREFAETAYGIRHVKDFGHNDIMASNVDYLVSRLKGMEVAS